MIRMLLLAFTVFLHLPALAVPKDSAMENDCRQLAARDRVPAEDMQKYVVWCRDFSKSCYQLEDSAANACGEGGAPEQNITKKSAAASAAMKARKGSYQVDGSAYGENCKSAAFDRNFQVTECNKAKEACEKKVGEFTSPRLPKKLTLACTTFSPESGLWSLNAKKPNICSTIQAEIDRVNLVNGNETQLCSDAGRIVDKASADSGIKLQKYDARACGILGCVENPDGTFSPKRLPSSNSVSPPSRQDDTSYVPPSRQDRTQIVLDKPDARACGIWGCQQNLDGTFSPKTAP